MTLLVVSSSSFRRPLEDKVLDLPSLLLQLPSTGFRALEAASAHFATLSPGYLDQLRNLSSVSGISICCLDLRSDFAFPDPAERARQLTDLQAWINLAVELDVPLLRLRTVNPDLSPDPSLARQLLVDSLNVLLPHARSRRRRLALHDNAHLFAPDDLLKLLVTIDDASSTDAPTLGLSLDVRALPASLPDRLFHLRVPCDDQPSSLAPLVRLLPQLPAGSASPIVAFDYLGPRNPADALAEIRLRIP